uniref:Caspase-1-like n=1 Tax=Phascolarctos cinereus TaxID=38626 RepID=A0A6P5L206_PHACI|nr:caspase-1-like [Phascolarctos cinereus]
MIYPIMEKGVHKLQALIICNIEFDHLPEQSGAEHDVLGMTERLKDLGYNVDVKENLTAQITFLGELMKWVLSSSSSS